MDNQKNDKGVIILLVIIIVILLVLCIIFATGTISFNFNKLNDNSINENDINNNQINQNGNESNGQEYLIKNFYDTSELNVEALKEYSEFDNISNNTNITESLRIGDKYFAYLDIAGKVKVNTYVNDKWITGYLNVDNIIDIIVFDIPASEEEQLLYLLTDEGDVYWYKFGEADNKKFSAVKVDTISNVQKLFISRFAGENTGGSWALFAITKSNDCVMLKGESV